MDEQDRMADQNPGNVSNNPPTEPKNTGEAVPVPDRIREAVEEVRRRTREEASRGRDVVREYEDRYHNSRRSRLEATGDTGANRASTGENVYVPAKAKRQVTADVNERKWAALAHASTLLTALVAIGSGGAGVLITMLVPLCIYFAFRKRSEYVAFHALQAFAIQLVGTVGFLALLIVGTVVWVALLIISALLILVLIGLLLLPLVALMFPLFVLASLALPIGMVIYSVIATVETWGGHDYRYPYIARWVDSQLHNAY